MKLLFIRHGVTSWNERRRIQGHSDIELSPGGRQALATRRVPPPWCHGRCFSSPLKRALQTAHLLLPAQPEVEPSLVEMNWGEWEGQTLAALESQLGRDFIDNAARGLDFRPSGGESPREVMQRLEAWLGRLPLRTVGCAFTHKGVIRAALALSTGWDMREGYPERVDYAAGHAFEMRAGRLAVDALNVSLDGPDSGDVR